MRSRTTEKIPRNLALGQVAAHFPKAVAEESGKFFGAVNQALVCQMWHVLTGACAT